MIICYRKYPRLKGGEIIFLLPGKTGFKDRLKTILRRFKHD